MSEDLMRRVADLEAEVKGVEEDMRQMQAQIAADKLERIKQDRDREVAQLKWGIGALGAMTMALGGWIWSQIGHLFNLR